MGTVIVFGVSRAPCYEAPVDKCVGTAGTENTTARFHGDVRAFDQLNNTAAKVMETYPVEQMNRGSTVNTSPWENYLDSNGEEVIAVVCDGTHRMVKRHYAGEH